MPTMTTRRCVVRPEHDADLLAQVRDVVAHPAPTVRAEERQVLAQLRRA